MSEAVPIAQQLLPLISKAATNTGYLGTIGTGVAAISLLANTKIAKEAVRLLIAKTGILDNSPAMKKALADAMRDAGDFGDAQADINMHDAHHILRGDKRRTDDWHVRPKRIRTPEIRRAEGQGPLKKARF